MSSLVLGDMNHKLDSLEDELICQNETSLKKIITDFGLCDFFLCSERKLSMEDKRRIKRQNQILCENESGNTFFPKIIGHRPSRIDGCFVSVSLVNNMSKKISFLTHELPCADHKTLHVNFTWSLAGLSADGMKQKFFFRNSLLSEKHFVKKIKNSICEVVIQEYRHLGGLLPEAMLRKIDTQSIENILFDRIKNDKCDFSAVDVIYKIFEKIEHAQNEFLKRRNIKENCEEIQMIENLKTLENIKNPTRNQQRRRVATSKSLCDFQQRRLKRRARDSCISYNVLGESGTKFFLRSRTQRRRDAWVRILQDADGNIITDSDQIESYFVTHFKRILSTPDPFSPDLFYEFIEPCKEKFRKISDSDKKMLSGPITLGELKVAVSGIRSQACSGPDGVSGDLLRMLHSFCPRLLLKMVDSELLKGLCAEKKICERNLIFLPKNNGQITIKAHRPISLLNSAYKLGDSCIVQRLTTGLENAKVLPPCMSAYRKSHSISDANLSLQTFIENAQHSGQKMIIFSFDIQGAFDNCSQKLSVECMRLLNFNEDLATAFLKLPIGAVANICVNMAEGKFPGVPVDGGTPQGQKSSSYKYSLCMLALLNRLNASDLDLFRFELSARKSGTILNLYTEMRWKEENKKGKITQEFKKRIKEEWQVLEKNTKILKTAEVNRKCRSKGTVTTIEDVESTLNYSDDGNLMLRYESIETILRTLEIFEKFGEFSGLRINTAKTRIVSINFELTEDDKLVLTQKGFCRDMICDANQSFRFLGFDFLPNDLKKGASDRLEQIASEMKRIASAFPEKTTLKGRKTVCSSLMLSKLSSIINTFEFSEKEFKGVQRVVNHFCHKKKIVAGAMKHLSYAKGGIQIPYYYVRHLVARTSLLKKLHYLLSEGQTLPLWGEVVCRCLKYIGFKAPIMLLKSMAISDLKFVVQKLEEMGFRSLAGIFRSALTLSTIHENRRSWGKSGQSGNKKSKENAKTGNEKNDVQTCLFFRRSIDGNILNPPTVGRVDRYGRFTNVPDPPSHRSQQIIGSAFDDDLDQRNKKSLLSILNDLREGGGRCSAFEMSARNPDVFIWIVNSLSSPTCLLDENDQPAKNNKIETICNMSSRHMHIYEEMIRKAKILCRNQAKVFGSGSPIHVGNPFSTWISACTKKSNSASIYFQTITALYQNVKSTTIKKLEKIGVRGHLTNDRIGKSLKRVVSGYNTFRMEKASLEFSLGAIRWARDIARIQKSMIKPCHICGIHEYLEAKDGQYIVRNPYKHLLFECTPAKFLSQYVDILLTRVSRNRIKITLELLILNELPYQIVKDCNKETLKVIFTILNVFRTSLYSIYYKRQWCLNGKIILEIFNWNLGLAKAVCKERMSGAMENVGIPTLSFHRFISYQRIHSAVMNEMKNLRKIDNLFIREHRIKVDNTNSITTQRRASKNKKPKKMLSKQKKQILILECLKQIPKKKFTKCGQLELVM